MDSQSANGELSIVQGDFYTDGKKFVFRLSGTSLSGVGDTPTAAFEDLMRVEASASPLATRMKELARDQQGEKVRAEIVRMCAIGLIVFGVVGGAIAASATVAPIVIADVSSKVTSQLVHALDNMPPDQEAALTRTFAHLDKIMKPANAEAPACSAGVPVRQP